MIRTLAKTSWLLGLAAILDAIYSFVFLFTQNPDGSLSFRQSAIKSTVELLGRLALGAGACTIAAGLWRAANRKSWFLVLNGVGFVTLGLIFNGMFGSRISLRTVALLFVVIAMSLGLFQLGIARALRPVQHVFDKWLFGITGAACLAFAFAFLALALRWIKLQPFAHWDILWFGGYVALSAVCMLALAVRGPRSAVSPG